MSTFLKNYKPGYPCMMGQVVGRIVGECNIGSWGIVNDIRMFSIPLFCTPHGTLMEVGLMHLSEITDEGIKKLGNYIPIYPNSILYIRKTSIVLGKYLLKSSCFYNPNGFFLIKLNIKLWTIKN